MTTIGVRAANFSRNVIVRRDLNTDADVADGARSAGIDTTAWPDSGNLADAYQQVSVRWMHAYAYRHHTMAGARKRFDDERITVKPLSFYRD